MTSVTHSIDNSPISNYRFATQTKEESITLNISWKALLRKKKGLNAPS